MATRASEAFYTYSCSLREFLFPEDRGFLIPNYQRTYSWDFEKVADLITDIIDGVNFQHQLRQPDKHFTYIGGIITTEGLPEARRAGSSRTPTSVYSVVDGQQRLSTVVIICLALMPTLYEFKRSLLALNGTDAGRGRFGALIDEVSTLILHLERLALGKDVHGQVFPKIIRAYEDKWSTDTLNEADFGSTLCKLIVRYNTARINDAAATFTAPGGYGQGSTLPVDRFKDISSRVRSFSTSPSDNLFGKLISFEEYASSQNRDNHLGIDPNNFDTTPIASFHKNCVRLLAFGHYLLDNVAISVIQGRTESFALEVFESLNTTGEPLNALETLAPTVIRQLDSPFGSHTFRQHLDGLNEICSRHRTIVKKQRLVSASIINFALAFDGRQVSRGLGEQRKYLLETYPERSDPTSQHEQNAFLVLLKCTLEITYIFEKKDIDSTSPFLNLLDDDSKMCLLLLSDIKHTIVIPLISRFYQQAILSALANNTRHSLNAVIRAVTAFSALWRAAWGGTAGIDGVYRSLMVGSGAEGYCYRGSATLNAEHLKNRLVVNFYQTNGSGGNRIENNTRWIQLAKVNDFYAANKKLSRFLLLAAQHDSIVDRACPGMVVSGVNNVSPSFTLANYKSEENYTLEHIAPQSGIRWDPILYENIRTINTLGNLVLMPRLENQLLSNRSWDQKRIIFSALSRQSHTEREQVLHSLGTLITPNARERIMNSIYMAPLDSISLVRGDWNLDIIGSRSVRILERAFAKIGLWLF